MKKTMGLRAPHGNEARGLSGREKLSSERLISERSRLLGKRLLEQQCWCWGHDVRYAGGNLLLRYGLERQRPPADIIGATTYSLCLLPDRFIALWGFGLWYGQSGRGAVFVHRFGFNAQYFPYTKPPTPVWEGLQIQALHHSISAAASTWGASTCTPSTWGAVQSHLEPPLTCELLLGALHWITDYEQWLLSQTGLDYRQKCLEAWSQRFMPPEHIVPGWQRLSRLIQNRHRLLLKMC